MATRGRENGPGGEKRGTSPSPLAQRRSSLTNPKTRAPAQNQDSAAASEKQIPNYLKPTISSGTEALKQPGKKPMPSDSAHKPSLARRRSFDKPPSPSRTQKTRISPSPTLRSHSFSSKTSAVQNSVPEKPKSSKDAGKQGSTHAKTISTGKKISMYVKKQGTGSKAAITKEQVTCTPENTDICDAPQPEVTESNDQKIVIPEAKDEINQVESDIDMETQAEVIPPESNIEMGNEVSEMVELDQTEAESDQVDREESNTVSEEQDTTFDVKEEEPEERPQIEETVSGRLKSEEHVLNETNNSEIDDDLSDNPIPEVAEKDGEEIETVSEKKEEATNGCEVHDSTETEVEKVEGEVKHEAESTAAKEQGIQGKKDSAVSNDVIEETASKLREQRKNKVKALAGAFETVISLQEPK